MKWYRVALSVDDLIFPPQNITELQAGGKTICVARFAESLFAFTQKCPHAGGFMVEGYLDGSGNVVCPVHRYKFNLSNGRNAVEGYYLKTYPVEVRPDGVFVGV